MDSQALRNTGLKVTNQRIKILQVFEQANSRHLSAEDVYRHFLEQGEDMPLATIYRALTQFASAGLLRRSNFESEKAVFEINEGTHHDHLICLDCGHVVEFYDKQIEDRQKNIAEQHGFALSEHSLALFGHCVKPNCASKKLK